MAKVPKDFIYSFTREEVSNIYQAALVLEINDDLDEEQWWDICAPVFRVANCWLSGDKDQAVQLVHNISLSLLDQICHKLSVEEQWDWEEILLTENYKELAKRIPENKFGDYLMAMAEAFRFANLSLYSFDSTLDRFREFPLLSPQGSFVEGIFCKVEGKLAIEAAEFAAVAFDEVEPTSGDVCTNFSYISTGFDCSAAVFRIQHADFAEPIGYVVKTYGPWSASFFGGGFVEAVDECIDDSDELIPPVLVLDGIQRAIEINKPFEVSKHLAVTEYVICPGDDEEIEFYDDLEDAIKTHMPGTYRTFALNTDYAEITLDGDGDIDWNESATLFINEKALDVLGLSAK